MTEFLSEDWSGEIRKNCRGLDFLGAEPETGIPEKVISRVFLGEGQWGKQNRRE